MGSSLNGNYCWCQGAGGGGGGGDITALLNPLWTDAEMATARRCHRTSSADALSHRDMGETVRLGGLLLSADALPYY